MNLDIFGVIITAITKIAKYIKNPLNDLKIFSISNKVVTITTTRSPYKIRVSVFLSLLKFT